MARVVKLNVVHPETLARWKSLAASVSEEIENTAACLPMEKFTANLPSYFGAVNGNPAKGWRQKPFYKGDVFTVEGCRVGTKPTLLFKLVPMLIKEELSDEGFQHCEADVATMRTLFGENAFDDMFRSFMGCSVEEAIETIGMKPDLQLLAPKGEDGKPVKTAIEEMADFGDW